MRGHRSRIETFNVSTLAGGFLFLVRNQLKHVMLPAEKSEGSIFLKKGTDFKFSNDYTCVKVVNVWECYLVKYP